jgi:hypothetical protein
MIPIRKNMPMSHYVVDNNEGAGGDGNGGAMHEEGENCFEDEDVWKNTMEDRSAEDQDRQEMLHEARDKELAQATVEGRAYVVALDASRIKSAEQARASGKALLLWCAQRTTVEKILPDDMVAPEQRTPDHLRFSRD